MGATAATRPTDCICGCEFYDDKGRPALILLELASVVQRRELRALRAGEPLVPHMLLDLEVEDPVALDEALDPAGIGETSVALAFVTVSGDFRFLRYWATQLRAVDHSAPWAERHLAVCRILRSYDGWSEPTRLAAASWWAVTGADRNHHDLAVPYDFWDWDEPVQIAHFSSARARALD